LGFIRTFVDNDLAFSIPLRDFAGPFVKCRPIQPRKRRIVEVTFNDVTDEGRLAIAVGARQVELATTIHSAIAVIIGFALEQPLITHRVDPPLINISCASETGCLENCRTRL
jgi:hypothetical protein